MPGPAKIGAGSSHETLGIEKREHSEVSKVLYCGTLESGPRDLVLWALKHAQAHLTVKRASFEPVTTRCPGLVDDVFDEAREPNLRFVAIRIHTHDAGFVVSTEVLLPWRGLKRDPLLEDLLFP